MTTDVSVVVPTRDRPELLERLVRSLLAQDHPSFEVIVVDDGSDEPPDRVLERVCGPAEAGRLRLLRLDENRGPATARNLGWRSAMSPLIAFIDDDCVATPSWLHALCNAAAPDVIVQGRTTPDGDMRSASAWAKSQNINRVTMRFETCNLLIPKDVLERLNGFDERFPAAAGEDTDLGFRAIESGSRVVFAPDAHVRHVIWNRSFPDHLRDRRRWADTALVVKKHPRIREELPLRFLYRRAHGVVLVGVPFAVTLAFTPLRWLVPVGGAAWVVAYTVKRGARYGAARAAQRSVETLVSAMWEVGLFARSSIRFRTFVL